MPQTANRHRSADVAVGYAADRGAGIAFATVATAAERSGVKLPFAVAPLPGLTGREAGYAAIVAVAGWLRSRGYKRLRLRLADQALVEELNGRSAVPPPLAIAYVKARCALHGFALARVELAEPIETLDLEGRARAEVALRTPAAA